jgi:hypothetical protein
VGGGQTIPLSEGADFSPVWQTVGLPLRPNVCAGTLSTIDGTTEDDSLFGDAAG